MQQLNRQFNTGTLCLRTDPACRDERLSLAFKGLPGAVELLGCPRLENPLFSPVFWGVFLGKGAWDNLVPMGFCPIRKPILSLFLAVHGFRGQSRKDHPVHPVLQFLSQENQGSERQVIPRLTTVLDGHLRKVRSADSQHTVLSTASAISSQSPAQPPEASQVDAIQVIRAGQGQGTCPPVS